MTSDIAVFGTPPEPEVDESQLAQPVEDLTTQPPVETEPALPEEGYIRLRRDQLGRELARLQRDEPEFANVLNSLVGQKARAKYQPKIDELSQEIERIKYQEASRQYSTLSPEEIGQRSQADPQFANDYATYRRSPSPDISNNVLQMRQQIENIFDAAIDSGLPIDRAESFRQEMLKGKYDKDSSGQPLDFGTSLGQLQRDLFTEIVKGATPPAPPTASRPTTPTPAVRDTASPDLSTTSRGSNGASKFTWDEIKAMSPNELLTYFPNDDDITNAIRSGRISGVPTEATEALI